MRYFSNIKLKQKVFSLIYGKGIVIFVLPKEHMIEGFYTFAVEYKKKHTVYYTIDGYPNWQSDTCCQTVFYRDDVNLVDIDTQDEDKTPTEQQILKWQSSSKLEIQCPSGIWRNIEEAPSNLVKKAIKKAKYHLFRKQKK